MKRVIVCTDIRGQGEPDDSFSLAHVICFQHFFDLRGFIITRPAGKKKAFNEVIKAFEADKIKYGFELNTDFRVEIGAKDKAPARGYDKPTAGSRFIIEEARKGELIVLCWGSANDVAQAVHDRPSIIPNLRVFLGGVSGYNFEKDPAPYHYIKNIDHLCSIWTNEAGKGMNIQVEGGPKYSPKGYVEKVLKPCGKIGKLLAKLSSHTTTGGLKWGDSQGVLFTATGDWDEPSKKSWGGKYKKIRAKYQYIDVDNSPAYIERHKALLQWEARLKELYI